MEGCGGWVSRMGWEGYMERAETVLSFYFGKRPILGILKKFRGNVIVYILHMLLEEILEKLEEVVCVFAVGLAGKMFG